MIMVCKAVVGRRSFQSLPQESLRCLNLCFRTCQGDDTLTSSTTLIVWFLNADETATSLMKRMDHTTTSADEKTHGMVGHSDLRRDFVGRGVVVVVVVVVP